MHDTLGYALPVYDMKYLQKSYHVIASPGSIAT